MLDISAPWPSENARGGDCQPLAIEKICSHQKFESNFGINWKLRDFGSAVGIAHLVGKVLTNFL